MQVDPVVQVVAAGEAGLARAPEDLLRRDPLADLRLVKELLGYKPIVPFEEGLRRTVEWYRSMSTTT